VVNRVWWYGYACSQSEVVIEQSVVVSELVKLSLFNEFVTILMEGIFRLHPFCATLLNVTPFSKKIGNLMTNYSERVRFGKCKFRKRS